MLGQTLNPLDEEVVFVCPKESLFDPYLLLN